MDSKENEKSVFGTGDLVSLAGLMGEVISVREAYTYGEAESQTGDLPVCVEFKDEKKLSYFTYEGKLKTAHTEPLLKLVKKLADRKMVSQTKYVSVVKYDSTEFGSGTTFYNTPEEAVKAGVRSMFGERRSSGYSKVEIMIYEDAL